MRQIICLIAAVFILAGLVAAQESRGTIQGRVKDSQGGVIVNATVVVTNTGTNMSVRLATNDTGYYQAVLLMPGEYTVTAEAPGFKKTIRSGITILVADRREVDLTLEVGAIADAITVTGEPPLIDASRTESGRQLDERTIHDVPTMSNTVVTLLQYSAGVQSGGASSLLGPHSTQGGSDYNNGLSTGSNTWSVDGGINDSKYSGGRSTTASLPNVDAVSETRILTTTFDGSFGHSIGLGIQMMTKGGANQFHGTVNDQHWQQRWQANNLFEKQARVRAVNTLIGKGDTAGAQALANSPIQPSGHSNNYALVVTGPVWIPKVFNGRDKLFFSFTYSGERDKKPENLTNVNKTVPTAANKKGDFSDLLNIATNPAQYQIYDPLSVAAQTGSRQGHFVRLPISGNVLPASYIAMGKKFYDYYAKFWPDPNNRASATSDLTNDYSANDSPYDWIFNNTSGRLDYNLGQKHRFFGRYTDNTFKEYRGDWTSKLVRGFNNFVPTGSGVNRYDQSGVVDWVFTATPSIIVHASGSVSNWSEEGAVQPWPFTVKPTDVGLPSYMDTQCGSQCIVPYMNVGLNGTGANQYSQMGISGYPAPTYYRFWMFNGDTYYTKGSHSVRFGIDLRKQVRSNHTANAPAFQFANNFFRQYDDGYNGYAASSIGLSWASFMMGLPTAMNYGNNDNSIVSNPFYGWFVQDTWRVTPKLTLTLSLRAEYETGARERYNRMVIGVDPNATLPISAAAEAAFAAKTAAQLPQIPVGQFKVRGGALYAGSGQRAWGSQLMWLPRIGFGYQLGAKTIIRGGYGVYYDAVNVQNWGIDQAGFSQNTGTQLTPDGQGVAWNYSYVNGSTGSPLNDPFPLGGGSDGGRFLTPLKSGLGLLGKAGGNFNVPVERHARQQRWRIGIERQIASHDVVEAVYEGTYVSDININVYQAQVPAAYYNFDRTRNDSANATMTANVPNPFNYNNADYSSIASSNPNLYAWMKQQGIFNGANRTRAQLVAPNPFTQYTLPTPAGYARTQMAQVSYTHRFSQGLVANLAWTGMVAKAATGYFNNWTPDDPTVPQSPYWLTQNSGSPNRVVGTWVYDMPFGKGRKWLHNNWALDLLAGGWTLAGSYLYQPGGLLGFTSVNAGTPPTLTNLFYYGDPNNIKMVGTFDQWFTNTGCVQTTAVAPGDSVVGTGACTSGFEKRSSFVPAGYQARAFPQVLDGIRGPSTHHWNGSIARDFRIKERLTFQARVDALNLLNHSYFGGVQMNPTSGQFGQITSGGGVSNRFIQVMGRLRW